MKRLQRLITNRLPNFTKFKKHRPAITTQAKPTSAAPNTNTNTTNMPTTDLTTSSPIPSKPTTPAPLTNPPAFPPRTEPIDASGHSPPTIQPLSIPVTDSHGGSAPGILHLPNDIASQPASKTAAILLSGAGGGTTGPSALYLSLATKLPSLSARIPTLRLDYRFAARTKPCVNDARAAMDYMAETYGTEKFVLVGWSFGGAPVFSLAGRDERVVGAATVASQTADALTGARECGRRALPVLLMHGTGDKTLSPRCSRYLHEAWFEGYRGEDETLAKMVMFEGDDHALSRNAKGVEEMMAGFIVECAGKRVGDGDESVVGADVLRGQEERVETMKKGGDLRGKESVE
ncbi:hypothetical protein PMZ80_009345 [Knufia obscura]|uniref:Alpha/beta-hydrolase n=1 Tax=Knufia obscura TaxID=1635080 RepID=A0ABR0RDR2_9EURO|nr:hypothetical protein PMZ80_009345 [Knufia obscura]